jgi:hypothetical protein
MATARGYGSPTEAQTRYDDGASGAKKDLPSLDDQILRGAYPEREHFIEATEADPSLRSG